MPVAQIWGWQTAVQRSVFLLHIPQVTYHPQQLIGTWQIGAVMTNNKKQRHYTNHQCGHASNTKPNNKFR
jgi:hypothetical protein